MSCHEWRHDGVWNCWSYCYKVPVSNILLELFLENFEIVGTIATNCPLKIVQCCASTLYIVCTCSGWFLILLCNSGYALYTVLCNIKLIFASTCVLCAKIWQFLPKLASSKWHKSLQSKPCQNGVLIVTRVNWYSHHNHRTARNGVVKVKMKWLPTAC